MNTNVITPRRASAIKYGLLSFILILCVMKTNAQIQLQLTASDYNGYNISCFGGRDGTIDLTITGGTPPDTIFWNTLDTL